MQINYSLRYAGAARQSCSADARGMTCCTGRFRKDVPQYYGGRGRLRRPSGLSFDSVGNLYVSSMTNEVRCAPSLMSRLPECCVSQECMKNVH